MPEVSVTLVFLSIKAWFLYDLVSLCFGDLDYRLRVLELTKDLPQVFATSH